jgi:hypothetical protein
MAYYVCGIFTTASTSEVVSLAKEKWNFVEIEEITSPFSGYAIMGFDLRQCNSKTKEGQAEIDFFVKDISEFSLNFPDEVFLLMDVWDHGDESCFQGFACQNGEVIVNCIESSDLRWDYDFNEMRLKTLTDVLGDVLDKNGNFRLFAEDHFKNQYHK